jgi:hypothetical protein
MLQQDHKRRIERAWCKCATLHDRVCRVVSRGPEEDVIKTLCCVSNGCVRVANWRDRVHLDTQHDLVRPQVFDGSPGDVHTMKQTLQWYFSSKN